MPQPSPRRETRVDFLRGLALVTIFVDHIPGDVLGFVTLHNFGLADGAELFVLFAGFSSMLAYGGTFHRDRVTQGLRRPFARCLRLYLYQAALLLATLVTVRLWAAHFGIEPGLLAPFAEHGANLRHGLTLTALPAYLDILPLYIVLLGLFPLIYGGLRWHEPATLGISGALWLGANLDPHLNLHNGLSHTGWYFDPAAWQFLFVLGAWLALVFRRGNHGLPHRYWLDALAAAYLVFAFFADAPWRGWGLGDWTPIALGDVDKTTLSPWRLLDILALVYFGLTSETVRRVANHRFASLVRACGRHSLEIFALGTLLSLFGRLIFSTYGSGWATQVLVNVVGLGILFAATAALERTKVAMRRPGDLAKFRPTEGIGIRRT